MTVKISELPAIVGADITGSDVIPVVDVSSGITKKMQLDANLYRRGNILGTVSQSGGSSTGAIIQRGSNANGEFVRFADGTQICWCNVEINNLDLTMAEGSLFRTSDDVDVTFPAVFASSVADVAMNVTARSSSGGFGIFCRDAVADSTGATILFFCTISTEITARFSYIAAGRWF